VQGLYCLANDGVIDWLIAFLRSVRAQPSMRELPITVIPYDDRLDRTMGLRDRYRFDVLDDPALGELDRLGQRVAWPPRERMPHFRKLAAFWGPYEEFLFLDADIVVVDDLMPFLRLAGEDRADLLYFDHDVAQVYRAGAALPFDVRVSSGFNTGAFASRRGVLDLGELRSLAEAAEPFREAFVDVGEQPFVNFVFDTTGRTAEPFAERVPDLAAALRAGLGLELAADGWRLAGANGPRVPMVHWAGFTPTPWMPHKALWLEHRLAGEPGPVARGRLEARLVRLAARQALRRAERLIR
jgi:hypothetical protein